MILPGQRLPIVIATRPVDFRRGHDGLAATVQNELGLDPHSGLTVVFRSKRGDRIKVLVWDGTGLVLIYKRLEAGSFTWPKIQDGVMRLSRAQFEALFEGLDWRRVMARRVPAPPWRGEKDRISLGGWAGVGYDWPCRRPSIRSSSRTFLPRCGRLSRLFLTAPPCSATRVMTAPQYARLASPFDMTRMLPTISRRPSSSAHAFGAMPNESAP